MHPGRRSREHVRRASPKAASRGREVAPTHVSVFVVCVCWSLAYGLLTEK